MQLLISFDLSFNRTPCLISRIFFNISKYNYSTRLRVIYPTLDREREISSTARYFIMPRILAGRVSP